jgi:hypothetical protein
MARPDGSPNDVDREFVAAFFIFNVLNDREAGLMHGINGYIFWKSARPRHAEW